MVLGQVDLDSLVEQNCCEVGEWEKYSEMGQSGDHDGEPPTHDQQQFREETAHVQLNVILMLSS